MTEKEEKHNEVIVCPECSSIESAFVEHSYPWWTYVHTCDECGYIIMESEWTKAFDQTPSPKS